MYMIRANLLISLVMLKLISRYAGIGVINTAIHWTVFALILKLFESGQAMANFGAFCVAVTFSFFANARWTFSSAATPLRYLLYVSFMGGMAALVGWLADACTLSPVVTLILFSFISLGCGFIYSNYIVFREVK